VIFAFTNGAFWENLTAHWAISLVRDIIRNHPLTWSAILSATLKKITDDSRDQTRFPKDRNLPYPPLRGRASGGTRTRIFRSITTHRFVAGVGYRGLKPPGGIEPQRFPPSSKDSVRSRVPGSGGFMFSFFFGGFCKIPPCLFQCQKHCLISDLPLLNQTTDNIR
jgi:hypothetical protein